MYLSEFFHTLGKQPCFRIYGKSRREAHWRVISVYAHSICNRESRWPLIGGACIAWTSEVILVGWDMAEEILHEQAKQPASRTFPVEVLGGRLKDLNKRLAGGTISLPGVSEVLAHEVGHTWQALRLGPYYLPFVGAVTLFREGKQAWNHFENEASEQGLFGGIVNGSVCDPLMKTLLAADS